MPRLSVWFIRTALLYLGAGFTIGSLALLQKAVPTLPWTPMLLTMHMEFLLPGWTLQLAMGVAYRMLPRFTDGPKWGDESSAWLAYILVNIGVLSVATGSLAGLYQMVLLGRIAETAATAAFLRHAWPRIKPMGG